MPAEEVGGSEGQRVLEGVWRPAGRWVMGAKCRSVRAGGAQWPLGLRLSRRGF